MDIEHFAVATLFIFLPLLVFGFVFALKWLELKYGKKGARGFSMSAEDQNKLDELVVLAKKMEERILTLEAILDAESPDWRQTYDSTAKTDNRATVGEKQVS